MKARTLACALLALCGCRGAPQPDTELYLWVWQRTEDLSFIDPAATKLALWVATITWRDQRLAVEPRAGPVLYPSGTAIVPVIRVEADGGLDHAAADLVGAEIRNLVAPLNASEVQLDFDATASSSTGSGDTGIGSLTGVGGAGGRVAVDAGGGGVVGRATGGFLSEHAPAASISTASARTGRFGRDLRIRIACPLIVAMLVDQSLIRQASWAAWSPCYWDQFGAVLLPVLVSCLTSLPSRATLKICDRPARVDMNAMCRPFGAKAGLSFEPSPYVSCRTCLVARSMILISNPGPVRAA